MIASRVLKIAFFHGIILCLVAYLGVAAGEEPTDNPGPEVQLDFTYGPLGPSRPAEFIAGEGISVQVQINGLTTSGDDDRADCLIQIYVKDEANQVIRSFPEVEFQGVFHLGGNSFTQPRILPGSPEWPDGKYSLEVIVTDRVSSKKVQGQTPFALLPRHTFGAQLVYLTRDQEGKIPLSAILPAGDTIYFHSTITGMEERNGKANLTTSIEVLDEKQRPIGEGPLPSSNVKPFYSSDIYQGFRIARPIHLNKPGRFTLRLTAKDEYSGEKLKHELPIVVFDTRLELKN